MNIPQRARELAEKIIHSDRLSEVIGPQDKEEVTRTLSMFLGFAEETEAMILAFAADVERDALERAARALDTRIAPIGTEQSDYYTGLSAGFSGARDAIHVLIATPTPERPDPTVALARFFEAEWGDAGAGVGRQLKWDDAALKVGLIEPDDPGFDYQLTALGHEAIRIAKENECG